MKRNIFLLFMLALMSMPAFAVDGYKNFKFGMTIEETKSNSNTPLHGLMDNEYGVYILSGKILFAGEKRDCSFFFIQGKLLRIAFKIPLSKSKAVVDSLVEKFGKPSYSSGTKSFEAVDTTPNAEAALGFDSNTVIIKFISDESKIETAVLIYTSLDYEKQVVNNQKQSIKDDL